MADQQIPLPSPGQIVSQQALYLAQISLYRNALAFGGSKNPSAIWASMVYNEPWTMAYYRELEDKDEDVANCLDSLKLSVLGRTRNVLPANENDSRAVDTKEFVEQQLAKINFHEVLDCVLDAPGYGYSVQEMVYDVSAGQASLMEIADCPQELFLFGNRFYPQIGQLQFLEQPWASEGMPVDENKFLVMTYRKRGRNRMGRPLLKSVFWPSWFKRNVERLWLQYAEKGPGTAVTRYKDADNESEKQKAVDAAQAIIDNTAVAIPEGMQLEVELLKVARTQDPAVYEKFFMAMQYSIARRILGETLTSFGNEGGTGSKAQGDVHADTLEQRSIELCRSVETVINTQLIRPLVLWNFGPAAPMPTWQFDLEQEEDLVKRLAIDAGLQRMGKKFTVGYVADRYDAPLAAGENGENPEDILVPNVSAPNVGINDQARATFTEGSKEQAHAETKEFDRVFDQLRQKSIGIFEKRTKELADAVTPVVRS